MRVQTRIPTASKLHGSSGGADAVPVDEPCNLVLDGCLVADEVHEAQPLRLAGIDDVANQGQAPEDDLLHTPLQHSLRDRVHLVRLVAGETESGLLRGQDHRGDRTEGQHVRPDRAVADNYDEHGTAIGHFENLAEILRSRQEALWIFIRHVVEPQDDDAFRMPELLQQASPCLLALHRRYLYGR